MAVRRVRPALGAALAGTVLALTGCAAAAPVTAPPFVVPSPPPFGAGGDHAGTAQQANDFLTNWVHSLSTANNTRGLRALEVPCHRDATCLALVRQAAALPVQPDTAIAPLGWSMQLDDVMRPDPVHKGSWTQVIRPFWRAHDTPYGGHDGWASATMLRVQLTATGPHTATDWRIRLRAVPASATHLDQVPLDHPVETSIG